MSDHDVDENHSEKKKKKKKKKSTGDVKKEQNITAVGDENRSIVEMEKKTEAKRSQVRTFGNGLVIEEVAMGKPDGKRASPGKKVILFPLNFLCICLSKHSNWVDLQLIVQVSRKIFTGLM